MPAAPGSSGVVARSSSSIPGNCSSGTEMATSAPGSTGTSTKYEDSNLGWTIVLT